MSGYRGTKSKLSKLVDAEVVALRALHLMGWSQYMLARVFVISRTHAKRIVQGTKWSWLK